MISSILAVCIGNVCRSPVAEACLRQMLPSLRIASAGLEAPAGREASPTMVDLARDAGLDLSTHRARPFKDAMPGQFDLILVMERWHLDMIARRQPALRPRAMMLTEWSTKADIPDPIREGQAFNAAVFDEIRAACLTWAQKLEHRK